LPAALKKRIQKKSFLVVAILVVIVAVFTFSTRHQAVDYNTQVKPIFNKKCITCHGGVRQKAGFSLLFRSQALANTESGKPAIIPGEPDKSELIRRLTLKDPEERMPFKHEPLSHEEIELLRRWIKEGAQWGNHWAYVPVQQTEVPKPKIFFGWFNAGSNEWVKNDIDYFILQKSGEKELTHSAEADKPTLLRRAGLDLIGLPAPARLAEQFFKDGSKEAYEKLVDSLLASPHFGERWAAMWLDLARYADTKGYERDDSRSIWRYRDWLINAFNQDKPYNQFLTEQLAGDLFPNPTDSQLIATAFHRNTMTNDEGGTDNEEFRTAAVMDRVNTTWEALMGTTFACVQCHSHPYDPFKHDEYYQFMAFFNNTRDEDTYADYPLLRYFNDSAKQEMTKLMAWLQQNATAKRTAEISQFLKTWQPAMNSLTCDQFLNSELSDTKWLAFRNKAVCRLKKADLENKNQFTYRYQAFAPGGVWQIHLDTASGPVLATIPLAVTKKGWRILSVPIPTGTGMHDIYFTYTNKKLKKPEDNGAIFDWFYFTESFPGPDHPGYTEAKKRYEGLLSMITPTTPVMMENPGDMHRTSHVFERGNWLVKGNIVDPEVPKSLNPFPANAPKNRLGLAMWLTSNQNPLTARTIVNRLWEQLFGTGLVETLEDMGTQGAAPTHKELLDYLSWKFMNEYNWSIKKLLREIVLSATYRQDAKVSRELLEKDPANKYYARGPRVRLSAEQIRDQALAITGLLSEKMYGASVMPYQPDGIWLSPWNGLYWINSKGEDKYRRAIYTYWKRTAPYPSMMTFDGAAREVCTARRIRTNTPLQALVTLNDEAYLDMARKMAYRLEMSNNNPRDQIRTAYERATGHAIEEQTFALLMKLYQTALQKFTASKDNACEMAGGNSTKYATAATAALVVVTNTILNLDEVVTKN
jgi:mono/diheme cytochrome c family protein